MKEVMALPGVQSARVKGSRALVRVDFNVPVVSCKIHDKTRIERVVPTVRYLVKSGAKVLLISHFGRPRGVDAAFSLAQLVNEIEGILGVPVKFIDSLSADKVNAITDALPWGSVVLLENLRFWGGETDNDLSFAEQLACMADIYVNDAFSCSHRKHASIDAISRLLPSFSGLSLQEELKYLSNIINERPVAAIIGGAKASTKIPMLRNLANKVDFLILGGGLSNNFLRAKGLKVGNSVLEACDEDLQEIFEVARNSGCEVILPVDHLVAQDLDSNAMMKNNEDVQQEDSIFDIGNKTTLMIERILEKCKTVFWNGPMGAFERDAFAEGTLNLASILVRLRREKGIGTIVGGGDSVCAIKSVGYSEGDFLYISTGGGALLHFLSTT